MGKSQGRYDLKNYINYTNTLQLRARLLFVASLDKNAEDENG